MPFAGASPRSRGTRVTLRTTLASLAEGVSVAGIVSDFPTLDEESVRAVIVCAAASAGEVADQAAVRDGCLDPGPSPARRTGRMRAS